MTNPISHYATGDGKTSCGLDVSKVSISNMADCVECLYQELKPETEIIYSPFPFRQAIKARAKCADGKVRTFRVGIPDTYFTIPAWGKINNLSVRGFISLDDNKGVEFTCLPSKHFNSLPEIFRTSHLKAKRELGK